MFFLVVFFSESLLGGFGLVWNSVFGCLLSNPVYMGIPRIPFFDGRILPLVLSTDSDATPGAGSWAKIHPATQADRGSYTHHCSETILGTVH